MTGLEDRYRRLLAWYPADHRARHGEEMIGVMLAGAEPGQRRPGPRETFDLVHGAIRIRAHRLLGPGSAPRWRDAMNAAAIVAPLHLVVIHAVPAVLALMTDGLEPLHRIAVSTLTLLPYTLTLGLALRGPRRTAIAWAWLWALSGPALHTVATGSAAGAGTLGAVWSTPADIALRSAVPVAVALLLTFAPDPAAGAELIGRRTLLRWASASLLALAAAGVLWYGFMLDFFIEQLLVPALLAMACGAGSRTPVGRRALLLLSPLIALTYGQQLPQHLQLRGWFPLAVEALIVALLFTVARRGFRPYGSGTVSSPDRLV
ncbi:hypothetical protein Ppa06_49940 [Planomonospora parontospora subsp. parontospora]|uniref:Uncharacterized protein n=2 Tax=Planomonospora parontospora TaxID=58119 RepID=A0AA37F7B8_9ACTN|nr:hypothetical protein [Planomonospora parontospora]GGK91675.1 hypothetical protein GCM10010126_58840 [Planomonospora parontospora]GII11196.1 hypothetical protein Ppa06_49940 [Planomonospora parontospora subsp. parontospora]